MIIGQRFQEIEQISFVKTFVQHYPKTDLCALNIKIIQIGCRYKRSFSFKEKADCLSFFHVLIHVDQSSSLTISYICDSQEEKVDYLDAFFLLFNIKSVVVGLDK